MLLSKYRNFLFPAQPGKQIMISSFKLREIRKARPSTKHSTTWIWPVDIAQSHLGSPCPGQSGFPGCCMTAHCNPFQPGWYFWTRQWFLLLGMLSRPSGWCSQPVLLATACPATCPPVSTLLALGAQLDGSQENSQKFLLKKQPTIFQTCFKHTPNVLQIQPKHTSNIL